MTNQKLVGCTDPIFEAAISRMDNFSLSLVGIVLLVVIVIMSCMLCLVRRNVKNEVNVEMRGEVGKIVSQYKMFKN